MSVDKKRQALEKEIAAERASARNAAPKEKVEPSPRPQPKGQKTGRAVRPKFLFLAAVVALLVAFGLIAGPTIGGWLSRSYGSLFDNDPAPDEASAITLEELGGRVEALTAKLEAIERQETPDLGPLTARLQKLEARILTVASRRPSAEGVPNPDAEETKVALETLQARLSALEARTVDTAGGEGLSLVAALLAQRAEAGRPFRVELLRLEAMLPGLSETGQQEAAALVAQLRPYARSGVASQQAIRQAFSPLIFETLTARGRLGDESEWRKVWAEISSLIVVRRTGEVEGENLEARLARAEIRLAADDLAGIVAELGAIEDAARVPLEGWLAEARTRLEVIEATTALELLIDETSRLKE